MNLEMKRAREKNEKENYVNNDIYQFYSKVDTSMIKVCLLDSFGTLLHFIQYHFEHSGCEWFYV